MRPKPASLAGLVVLVLIVLAASGCGGSSKSSAPGTNRTSASATTPASTTPATGGAGLGARASLASCTRLTGLETAFVSALSAGKSSAQQEGAVLQQFAARTPPGIRPDFEIVAAAFARLAGALKGTNASSAAGASTAEIAKLERLGSQLGDPQLTRAESAIGQWATANCHG